MANMRTARQMAARELALTNPDAYMAMEDGHAT
jgi:hypothetical protein